VKKHYLAAALAGAASLPAFARSSVTLYGVIDTNLEYAAATRYANGTFTPVGVTDETAFGANQTGVTVGIRHRF
jgi:predicted porin